MTSAEEYIDCIKNNNIIKLEEIVNKKYFINLNQVDKYKSTALHFAVKYRKINSVKVLLKHGTNPNCVDEFGNNCLHIVNNEELARTVIKERQINSKNKYPTPVQFAAIKSNSFEIVKLLLHYGTDVNAQNNQLASPLHCALAFKSVPLVALLLRYGADPNLQNINKESPFLNMFPLFAHFVNDEIINLFLNYGANIYLEDVYERNILFRVAEFGTDDFLMKLLHNMNFNVNKRCLILHSPFPFDRLMYKFDDERYSRCEASSRVKVFLRHFAVLNSQNMHIDEYNLTSIKKFKWTTKLFAAYKKELVKMQATKVSPYFDTTYYDMLVKRKSSLVKCLRCKSINEIMSFCYYKKLFLQYSNELNINYLYGLQFIEKIDKFLVFLVDVFENILPLDVICIISEFYNDEDFEACVKEFEFE